MGLPPAGGAQRQCQLPGIKLVFFRVQMDADAGDADMARLDRDVRHAIFSHGCAGSGIGRNGAGRPC